MKGVIYKIISPSGKIYIGQTTNFERRFETYKHGHVKSQKRLYASFKNYGFESHKFEILDTVDQEELDVKETYYINLHDSYNKGLNCTIGGRCGSRGIKHSEESRKKMSDAHKNSWYYDKAIETLKNRDQKGSKNSRAKLNEEIVRNIKADINNKVLSREIADKYNISIVHLHYIRSGKTWKHVTI